MKFLTGIAIAASLAATSGTAAPFGSWTEQRFPRLPANQWIQSPQSVSVLSDRSVSLLWTRVPASDGDASRASWTWSVDQSVPPTPLTQKGGDDRNLALYFVFVPEELADKSRNSSVRAMLRTRQARVLMYVWGGDHGRGALLPSPYLGGRGKTIVRRPAGTGIFSEAVDLEADFARAFGGRKPVLVGLAVSSDSDDTAGSVRARLGSLRLD